MKITIGFSRRNKFAIGSWLIAESEKRPYSHAYIRFRLPEVNEEMIFQASKGSVNLIHIDRFKEHNIIVKEYDIIIDRSIFFKFYKFVAQNLGKKYSKSQILWLTLAKLLQIKKWPSRIYDIIKNGESEEICSELALRVFELLGYRLPENVDVEQFTPSDLDELLSSRGLKANG